MKLPHTTFKGSQFIWDKNIGIAEASALGCRPGQIPGSKIYDDACDHGFTVIGNSRNILFLFSGYHQTPGDTDIAGFTYVSECGKFFIKIIND